MNATASEVRPHERMKVVFCQQWEAQALADYISDCRANPETQLPDYEQYRIDWLTQRLEDEAAQADAEAARQRTAEREQRQFPAPLADEDEFPF